MLDNTMCHYELGIAGYDIPKVRNRNRAGVLTYVGSSVNWQFQCSLRLLRKIIREQLYLEAVRIGIHQQAGNAKNQSAQRPLPSITNVWLINMVKRYLIGIGCL